MDLKSLFEMQKVLDYRIEQEHPRVDGEDRLGKKLLALQVELGELANELPQTFKFWSNKKNDYKKALVEYVDCLHFVLSIGLEIGMKGDDFVKFLDNKARLMNGMGDKFLYINKKLLTLYEDIRDKDSKDAIYHWVHLFDQFKQLSELLGFTWEQIERAYLNKNKINHERQNNGY